MKDILLTCYRRGYIVPHPNNQEGINKMVGEGLLKSGASPKNGQPVFILTRKGFGEMDKVVKKEYPEDEKNCRVFSLFRAKALIKRVLKKGLTPGQIDKLNELKGKIHYTELPRLLS